MRVQKSGGMESRMNATHATDEPFPETPNQYSLSILSAQHDTPPPPESPNHVTSSLSAQHDTQAAPAPNVVNSSLNAQHSMHCTALDCTAQCSTQPGPQAVRNQPGIRVTWFALPLCSHTWPKNSHSCFDSTCTMRTLSSSQSGCDPLALWLSLMWVRLPSKGVLTVKASMLAGPKALAEALRGRGLLSPACPQNNFVVG